MGAQMTHAAICWAVAHHEKGTTMPYAEPGQMLCTKCLKKRDQKRADNVQTKHRMRNKQDKG